MVSLCPECYVELICYPLAVETQGERLQYFYLPWGELLYGLASLMLLFSLLPGKAQQPYDLF